jgi:hypothetical protein
MVNIGSTSTGGKVTSVKADLAKITLITPACTELGEKVALSRVSAISLAGRVFAVVWRGNGPKVRPESHEHPLICVQTPYCYRG